MGEPVSEPPGAEPARRRRLRILFFAHNLGKVRHFDGVIERLTARGHSVVIAVAAKDRKVAKAERLSLGGRRIQVAPCPVRRVDAWRVLAPQLRLARDYLRFFEPPYQHATKLAARAAGYVPDTWRDTIEGRAWVRRHARLAGRALAAAEAAIPADPYLSGFIRYHEPDVVLVTPLVHFGSYQTDYVKAARALRVPVAFLPFSWDNLTNRGLIKAMPDRVLVWNEVQRREAIELHGVPAGRIAVTGAPRFDDFFALSPSCDREAFCRRLGLDPGERLFLYTCSSPFVAPREVEFVRRWIEAVRASGHEVVARASILIRPHPVHAQQWQDADFSRLPNVSIWREPLGLNADQGLFDSLTYCNAVVGLNTSAMLEAAILQRPVFTVLDPEFAGGQDATLHFQYLRWENGGIVAVAPDFAAHVDALERAVRREGERRARAAAFTESFIRPRGPGRADKVVVAEIERLPDQRAPASPASLLWRLPLRAGLRAALAARGPDRAHARVRTED